MKTLKTCAYILLFASLVLYSCKPDCDDKDDTVVILYPDYVHKVIPYKGDENFRFLKNNVDTVSFNGEEIKTTYSRAQLQVEPCDKYEQLEHKSISFYATNTNQRIGYEYYKLSRVNSNGTHVALFYNNTEIGDYDQGYFISLDGPPAKKDTACGILYDSVSIFTHKLGKLTFKPGFGIIKFTINADSYELIPD